MTARIRVVIAEDHYLVREGTRRLLEASGRIDVVASLEDGDALLRAVHRLQPDAALVDIRMPPKHQTEGIDAAREIRAAYPAVGVVVLSQYVNALYAFELFRNGTDGLAYLLKDRIGDLDELLRALDAVTQGGSMIDPLVVEGLLARGTRVPGHTLGGLTKRETEVLREMAQGSSNKGIADALSLSESAVEKHIGALFAKLGLDSADAALNRRVAAVLAFLRAYDPGSAS